MEVFGDEVAFGDVEGMLDMALGELEEPDGEVGCSYVGCVEDGEMWLWGVWVCEEHAEVMRVRASRVLVGPEEDEVQPDAD